MGKKEFTLDWMIKNYMGFFKEFGMEEHNIRDYFITWSKERPPLVADYLWYIFNQLLIETAKAAKNDYERYKYEWEIRSQMRRFRKNEGHKGNREARLQLVAKVNMTTSNLGVKMMVKVMTGPCCAYCDSFDGKLFTPEEFISQDIIPGQCTRETGCRCTVTFKTIRDED